MLLFGKLLATNVTPERGGMSAPVGLARHEITSTHLVRCNTTDRAALPLLLSHQTIKGIFGASLLTWPIVGGALCIASKTLSCSLGTPPIHPPCAPGNETRIHAMDSLQ